MKKLPDKDILQILSMRSSGISDTSIHEITFIPLELIKSASIDKTDMAKEQRKIKAQIQKDKKPQILLHWQKTYEPARVIAKKFGVQYAFVERVIQKHFDNRNKAF